LFVKLKLVPVNENRSFVTSSEVNEVVARREPAADVGVDDVRNRYTQVLLTLQQQQQQRASYSTVDRSRYNWVRLLVHTLVFVKLTHFSGAPPG